MSAVLAELERQAEALRRVKHAADIHAETAKMLATTVEAALEAGVSLRAVAEVAGIPEATLRRRRKAVV